MKIKFDIDCTPEEARAFFGLPDLAPLQEAVLEEVQKRTLDNLSYMDPEVMLKTWFPMAAQGWDDMRDLMTGSHTTGSKARGPKKTD